MKIDLQIHTHYSDGEHSPKEIATLAREGGLNVISVTDHDRVDSYDEVKEACDALGILAIPGVEISTTYTGNTLHVLGYGIDVKNEELISFLKEINEFRKNAFIERFPILNANLREAGKGEASLEKFKNLDARYYSAPGVAEFLFEQGVTESKEEGFQYFKGMRGTTPPIEPKDAIKIIHQAGGVAILSHPFAPKISLVEITENPSEQEAMIVLFKEQGLDGLECYQAGHSNEDVEFCLEIAQKYNLFITAGSDWHGYHSGHNDPIRKYLPYYIDKLGDLYVPEDKAEQIIKSIT